MRVLALFYFAFIAKLCSADSNGESLDISNPDESKVDIKEDTFYGVKWKVFTPKNSVKFTSFTEGELDILSINGTFQFARVSADPQTPLLYVGYRVTIGHTKYFEKVGGAWTEVTGKEFGKKIKEVKKNEAEKKETKRGAKNNLKTPKKV